MSEKHPVLSALSSIGINTAVFGFFVFYLTESHLIGFSFGKLILALVLLQFFDSAILRRSTTVGKYLLLNLPPAAAILAFARNFSVFDSPALLHYIFFYLTMTALLAYRIIRASSPAPESNLVFAADGLIVLTVIIRIWNQLNPFPGYGSLEQTALIALFFCFLHLILRRLSFSAPGTSGNVLGAGFWPAAGFFLLSSGIIGVFCLLSGSFFTSAASLAVTALQTLFSLFRRLMSAISRFLEWLISLLPDAPPGTLPQEAPIPGLEELAEQSSSYSGGYVLLAFVAVAAVLALLYCLAKFWRHPLNMQTAKIPAVKKGIPAFRLSLWLRRVLSALGRMLNTFRILVFRPDSIPALLLRAKWYGNRKGRPRKKSETVREYLNRLSPEFSHNAEKNPALLLSEYADRYLYGQTPPSVPKEELNLIKTAFSFF